MVQAAQVAGAPPAPAPLHRFVLWALPVVLAIVAYHEVHGFDFVFDDHGAILESHALRQGDWWAAAFGDYNSLSNRPLACLMLALELSHGPGFMHLSSLALHACNAVLVMVLVRLLARPRRASSLMFASLTATLWAVHPLAVDAVAYLTQRSMLLMGLFALTSTIALLRSHSAEGTARTRWRLVCVAAAALALASKEESAGLPILLVLMDRAFGTSSWQEFRGRWRFHLAIASNWLVLLACVALGPKNPTVGYATNPPATAWEWLLTQTQCLAHYVQNAFVPADLRGMYDFGVIRDIGPAVLPGVVIVAAIAATVVLLVKRPRFGVAGAAFFLLLAPTSSVYPIITELCADRRMYLPLLAIVVPVAMLGERRLGRAFPWLTGLVIGVFAWRTHVEAAAYRDAETFDRHAAASNELQNGSYLSGKILTALGSHEFASGNLAAAKSALERAMQCEAPGAHERNAHANLVHALGDTERAESLYRAILRDYPDDPAVMINLAGLLRDRAMDLPEHASKPLFDEAFAYAERACELAPYKPEVRNTYAVLLNVTGQVARARDQLEIALRLQPDFVEARRNLGIAHYQLGDLRRALTTWQPLVDRGQVDPMLAQIIEEVRRQVR